MSNKKIEPLDHMNSHYIDVVKLDVLVTLLKAGFIEYAEIEV